MAGIACLWHAWLRRTSFNISKGVRNVLTHVPCKGCICTPNLAIQQMMKCKSWHADVVRLMQSSLHLVWGYFETPFPQISPSKVRVFESKPTQCPHLNLKSALNHLWVGTPSTSTKTNVRSWILCSVKVALNCVSVLLPCVNMAAWRSISVI